MKIKDLKWKTATALLLTLLFLNGIRNYLEKMFGEIYSPIGIVAIDFMLLCSGYMGLFFLIYFLLRKLLGKITFLGTHGGGST